MCSQNSYVEILISSGVAFGGGAFGRLPGRERLVLMNGIIALKRET